MRDSGVTVAPTCGTLSTSRFRLQHLQRLAHRNGADVEPLREVVDHQPLAGPEVAAQDGAAQRPIDELLLGAVRRAGFRATAVA